MDDAFNHMSIRAVLLREGERVAAEQNVGVKSFGGLRLAQRGEMFLHRLEVDTGEGAGEGAGRWLGAEVGAGGLQEWLQNLACL